MTPHPDSGRGANESQDVHFDPGSTPMGLIAVMILVIGLAVWQFGSLAPKEDDFPSKEVDVSIRGNDILVFNPTHGIIDIYQVTIQRLSGSYLHTGRNLKPRTIKRIGLKSLRKTGGQRYDPSEDGECRIQLEYWRGTEKNGPFYRYCRGF